MSEMIVSLAYDALLILLPVLAAMLVEWLRRRLGLEKMQRIQKELETKQELASLAVRLVEQSYQDLKGEEKYNQAADWLVTQARQRGINITVDEVKGLIEAAVRTAKDIFGEEWAKQVVEPEEETG